jgi:quinol monooxygenase YgiN
MIIVLVYIHIKSEFIDEFREATIENALNSIKESGISRFDLIQQQDDVSRFVLIEEYRNHEATIRHKDSRHYHLWRDQVAEMMVEPRYSIKYSTVFPEVKN